MRPFAANPVFPVLILLFLTLSGWAALRNATVNDEFAAHVTGGYLYWKTGVFAGGVDNPPLGQLWVALPVYTLGYPLAPFSGDGIVAARFANILLAAALLVWVAAEAARRFGNIAAMIALGAGIVEPTFLANSTLATIDLPIAFAMWGSVVFFWRYIERPALASAMLCALFTALAVLTKVTALYLPVIFVATLAAVLCFRSGRRHLRRCLNSMRTNRIAFPLHLLTAVILGIVIVGAGFRFQGVGEDKSPLIRAHFGEAPAFVVALTSAAMRPLPRELLQGTLGKFAYAQRGNEAYLFGKTTREGWWWYYPGVFLAKSSLPFLLASLVALLLFAGKPTCRNALVWTVPLVILILASTTNRAQIGIRHLMPMYPFLFLALGHLAHILSGRRLYIALGCFVWALLAVVRVMPYPITFENELIARHGYKWLSDANYDWGQGNRAIESYLERNPAASRAIPWRPVAGDVVVRVNERNGFGLPERDGLGWTREMKPAGRIARAALVYRMDDSALQVLEQKAETDPEWCVYTASFHESMEQFDDAERWHARAVELSDSEPFILRKRAAYFTRQSRHLEAFRDLRRASLIEPEKEDLQRELFLAEKRLAIARLEDQSPPQALLERAALACAEGRPRDALTLADAAEGMNVEPASVALVRYWAMSMLGDYRGALALAEDFPESVRLAPASPPPDVYTRVINEPENAAVTLELGMHWMAQQRWDTAAEWFLESLRRDPAHREAVKLLGQIVVNLHQETPPMDDEMRSRLRSLKF